ncbi:hypothetical protein [Selenomonas sp. AB3002]|uniref:hypothetical protein n=1 Tax=Selenomonas sp. AB3002 TaxID=1392502 RepID=UPI000497A552
MALTEKDLKQITQTIEEVGRRIMNEGRKADRSAYKSTERRLRAYPTLKDNIQRYEADIKDIAREDMGKSADIVIFQSHSGKAPERDLEELRREKIFSLTERLYRDSREVGEIETALDYIKNQEYYRIVPMIYFEGKSQKEIEVELHCDRSTIWRNRKVLVARMSEVLYGADAL